MSKLHALARTIKKLSSSIGDCITQKSKNKEKKHKIHEDSELKEIKLMEGQLKASEALAALNIKKKMSNTE